MNMQLYKRFCQEEFNEHGTLTRFSIHHPDNFNFAYDVMDVLAAEEPDSEMKIQYPVPHNRLYDNLYS